jgi:DNA processing protein
MRDDIKDWLTLTALPGVGCALIRRLLDVFATPAAILAAGRDLSRIEGVGRRLTAVFTDQARLAQARRWAEQEYERVRAKDIQLLCSDDPLFPPLLRTIYDPPVLLYLRGNLNCLKRSPVAIIGSRAATSYGKRISAMLAGQLARAGIVVVSGLATGIDGHAHAGCLEAGGETVAVLGCGVDVLYPRSHAGLYDQVIKNGLLVSEYPLGTRPEGFRFPARNRIISGLSLGVVVVEATRKSGSLITARLALDQGREVFGVPGRIDSGKSEGVHRLLQQGAHLVQSAGDVLQELQLALAGDQVESVPDTGGGGEELSVPEKQLLGCLDAYPTDIDELAAQAGLPPGSFHDLLLRLELKGHIRQLPGQQYERV